MRPLFLDSPPRYTRTQREGDNPVRYAYPIEGPLKQTGYGRAWWFAMALICVATLLVVSGCSKEPDARQPGVQGEPGSVVEFKLSDGTPCASVVGVRGNSITCNWRARP